MEKKRVMVLGAGNIGSLISFLFSLHEDYEVFLASKDLNVDDFSDWSKSGITLTPLDTSSVNLSCYIDYVKPNVIVSALPYKCNQAVAMVAAERGIHYFDLTEDVGVKNLLVELAQQYPDVIFMPQCGVAPGFINIVGNHLMKQFDEVYTAKLRVGALPQQVSNAFNYALTWSTNGLVNEYGNSCEAVVNGEYVDNLRPLEGIEKLLIDGVEYEAFNTSGGLGTLAETWNGKVRNLNYKTLRYPGHCEKMKFLMFDMDLNNHRDMLESMLEWSIPTTNQDVIVIYSAVSGMINEKFVETSYVNKVFPSIIGDKYWTGIQITTAAGACAAVDLVLDSGRKGFIKQEDINFDDFIVNRFGQYYQM